MTNARRRGFELQSSELWGSKNDLSAQFQIQLIGFEPNLSHFSSLKYLYKKHVFRSFWGLSGGGRSRFYKRLCTRVSLQSMTKTIQKLGPGVCHILHISYAVLELEPRILYNNQNKEQIIRCLGQPHHVLNLCFVTLWVKGTLTMDSLNLSAQKE